MIRLAVRVRREQAELVLAELLELAPSGVEEVQRGERVEYAVYGAPGELPSLPALKAAAGTALIEVSTSETPDDWADRWRSFHRPVLIAAPHPDSGGDLAPIPALRIRPPWEPESSPRQDHVEEIVIDPAQAFGTGSHATTRLCLELLLSLASLQPPHGPLLDVGTGSGILAIAAARLGFSPVLAIDNEPESVEAARGNARANGVQLDVRRLDMRSQPLPITAAGEPRGEGVVVANLLRPLLLELVRAIPRAPAHVVAGGLLCDQVEEVVEAFTTHLELRERERRERSGWVAVWLSAR